MDLPAVESLGFAHFWARTDGVGTAVLIVLMLLSFLSWYLIVTRTLANWLARRRADAFLKRFARAASLAEMRAELSRRPPNNPFSLLAKKGTDAVADTELQGGNLADAGGLAEYLTRGLNTVVEQEAAAVEHGLTLLASAGSSAPYIGLFGTVWGIYHALLQIGLSGQGTLDKVAGPVGEALLMTALGLAVAIPAVLAYNAFNRRNRLWLVRLESFALDLYVLLTVRSGKGSVNAAPVAVLRRET